MTCATKKGLTEARLLLGSGKFSLISCFFFEHQFVVWPNLGLGFVSAKLCSKLVLTSRDPRPLAIPLRALHSAGAVMLFLDSRDLGKIKPSLGRACAAVRHKNKGVKHKNKGVIFATSPESPHAFNQTKRQHIPCLLYSATFKLALNSLLAQAKSENKFLFLLHLSGSQELW